ncbi:MAG TPA: alpha/beta hydrolase [Myxococcota bacterium]|nr:alpha/beta hydrolase [Myxococcota bacterium]
MAATLYLAGSIFILVVGATTWFQARRIGPLVPLYFFSGWLAGELALQVTAIGAIITIVFAEFGAFGEPRGRLGLGLALAGWGLLLATHFRAQGAKREIEELARESGLAIEHGDVSRTHGFFRPFRMKRAGVRRILNVPYGESLPGDKGGRNLLDVVLPEATGTGRPILVQIHGGGWMIGDKREQGGPLMGYLASRGWVCFAVNYRLSPKAVFPAHIVDVKRALGWVREHAHEYGADPNFICVTGGSAGGHLTALTALSQNDPAFQPGFEQADSRVSAAVPFYGVYDFLDRAGIRGRHSMVDMLAKYVFQCRPEDNPELWDAACPQVRVSADAPPFLVVQGTHDTLVFVEEAREFVRALREKSRAPVHYLEMKGAQHAFEIFHSARSQYAVRAAAAFLDAEHAKYRAGKHAA